MITALLLRHETAHKSRADLETAQTLEKFRMELTDEAKRADLVWDLERTKALEQVRIDLENKSKVADLERHKTIEQFKLDLESKAKIYEERIKTYTQLMDKVEEILVRQEVNDTDSIRLQFLFQKMAFVAGKPVLESMGNFAEFFSKAAEDGSIVEDREKIFKEFGKLTVKMRADLVEGEDENEDDIAIIIDRNIQFRPWSAEERDFLRNCEDDEKRYYSQIITFLKAETILYKKETVGISVKDAQGRSIVHLYPAKSRNRSQFVPSKSTEENPNRVQTVLTAHNSSATIDPSQMPVEAIIGLIREMAGKQ